MSLEAQIAALTTSIDRLNINIQAMNRGLVYQDGSNNKVDPAAPPEKPKKAPPAEVKKGTEPPPAPADVAKEDAPVLTYDDIKTPFLALVKLNREKAAECIAAHGLKAPDFLKAAKPEQYAAILKDLNAARAELEASA